MTTNQSRPGTRAKLRVKGPDIYKTFPVYLSQEEERIKE